MKRSNARGRQIRRGEPGFDEAVLGTSFSGRDPGRRPDLLVQANDIDEVVAAVGLAAREGWRISICSGGHSWAQNHLREGGLLLDLSRLRDIEIDAGAMVARAGPGCWCVELDQALKPHRLFFPVAHAHDVGLGGFLLQGGFGWNSRQVGMGCENVIGVDVVLADGTLIHASARENADMYWAARGAGPGYFGVVVRYHLRLHPRPRFTGIALQVFRREHLDEVFAWAGAVGAEVPRSVEFQLLITPKALGIFRPGVEVIAPVMADSWREARRALDFLYDSPARGQASFTTPLLPVSTAMMSRIASLTHFPPRMRWCADNIWTDAPVAELLPGLRHVADTMPPAPSHALWLNWYPPAQREDMAFSLEANRYFAVYGEWREAADDARYGDWATDCMRRMEAHGVGIQLADENLGRRPARFMADDNLRRLDAIRAARDPQGRFRPWMGRLPS
ncbi:MAG: FAD-binding oxidoreductase [Perlucidibaca sp.]